jgi:TonB family protein
VPTLHSKNLARWWGAIAGVATALALVGAVPAAAQRGSVSVVVPHDTQAVGTISGTVRDSTGVPVAGARVEAGSRFAALTDSAGTFALRGVPQGPVALSVRRIGYAPITSMWDLGAIPLSLNLRMDAFPTVLPTVYAEARHEPFDARLAGFYRRVGQKLGYYFTRAQIDSLGTFRMTDVLERVPGVRKYTMPGALGTSVTMAGSRCAPLVMVDGFPASMGRFDLNMIDLTTVEGIEVYLHGSSVPSELAGAYGMENCGLIAIWSRPMRPQLRADQVLPRRRLNLDSLLESNEVYTAASVDEAAKYTKGSAVPVYPDSLYRAGVSGRVVARFVVDTVGSVELRTIHIVSATEPPFGAAVAQALRSAAFSPARLNGRRVRQIVEMPFDFKYDPADTVPGPGH